ncbi:MAG: single-stranded DNA-binding protein [Puniceicoccales bacterium]|jgi:single-strand DNA-binding protein|nr:single-stranded DNA-binding protein [Puniceicoccales bacterium]
MASFNKVLLMGNLVRDPELRVTPSGLSVCRCTLACSRTIKSDTGSREEIAFVDVESFGKQGEVVAKHFVKGKPIFVEGRLRLNEWQTSAGEKRSKLLVVMENFVFVGSQGSNLKPGTETEGSKSSFSYETINAKPEMSSGELHDNAVTDEDVPF